MSDCYRIAISRGDTHLDPVVTAESPDEALAKVETLARELLKRRLPWLIDRGLQKPQPEDRRPMYIGVPRLKCASGTHR